ncbi:MAG: DUF6624 domain-containing protein [Pseudomonadota bacterium]
MPNKNLTARLVAMAERDQRVRAELAASGDLFGGYHEEMASVHEENADRLAAIVNEFGWPGKSLVGNEGAEAAWLIVQHAVGRPGFLRRCLPLLETAVEAGDVPARQVARLKDRIAVFEERPQRYGTQFDWDGEGRLSPHKLEDPERVDEYRASVGLAPLADNVQEIRQAAVAEGHRQPDDFAEYLKKRRAWARSVGWL